LRDRAPGAQNRAQSGDQSKAYDKREGSESHPSKTYLNRH